MPFALADIAEHRRRAVVLWPWISLAMGIASAALMDRRPERAWMVVAAIVLGWLGVLAITMTARLAEGYGRRGLAVQMARLSSRMAAQAPVQFALFFSIPFYGQAWAGTVGQAGFVALLALGAGLTLWDPMHQAVTRRPVAGAALHALATFAGFDALLPILGLSNRASFALAGAAAAAIVPAMIGWCAPLASRRRLLVRVVPLVLALAATLFLPAVRRLVPAAPMRLIEGGLGTQLEAMTLVDPATELRGAPAQLVCFTSLFAPRGVRDALVHVWRKEGVEVDRIPLKIRGGRASGFRTWSVKQNLGERPLGTWSCSVETASGQFLGERSVLLAPAPVAPAVAPALPKEP